MARGLSVSFDAGCYVIMNPSLLAKSNANFELCSDNDIWPSRRYETLQPELQS